MGIGIYIGAFFNLKKQDMQPKKEDIAVFNRYFDLKLKHLNEYILDYRRILMDQVLESANTKVVPDREFLLDLVEEGFVRSLGTYHETKSDELKANRDIMDQVNDILNAFDDD
jgi:hypothetical protein